jgi:EAL domain-containing protein (putative c-di-GMP-specific phosphodiesterase class I)
LAALWQFQKSDEKQVSINISARSLRDAEFVKVTLERIGSLDLAADEKIIIEIHESTPHLSMSRQVLDLYRVLGVGFAIDDVGLNMNDVLRLAEFDDLAEYVKIDRHSVCSDKGENSLAKVLSFVRTLMPTAVMVAEGVQNAEHALDIQAEFPEIFYAQGLFLPNEREAFKLELYNAGAARKTSSAETLERKSGQASG